ncbi:hypothetical protein [Streptomyces sp. NPDC001348]
MSKPEKNPTEVTTMENHSPVPPSGAEATVLDNQSPTPAEEKITTLENHSPVPPALDLDGK